MAGTPLPELRAQVKPKRERAPTDPENAEAEVQREVWQLLAHHPLVLFAVRQNSGALRYETVQGRSVPIWFYRIVTKQPVRVSDFWGFLKDKRPFAIECKRRDWSKPSDTREHEQALFLAMIQNLGGVSGFARSSTEAAKIIG